MDPATAILIGGAVSGAASYLGGQSQADAINASNAANAAQARRNIAYQKEFAKSGIQWKVEDARKAGIHPLAALGAQTTSFSPVMLGDTPNTATGSAMQNMGQDISRSINAAATQPDRMVTQLTIANAKLDLEGKALDNQIRASQLQKINAVGPAFPSAMDNPGFPGQGGLPVQVQPAQPTASMPGNPALEAGAINSYGYARTDSGYTIVPSKDAKERMEDDLIGETLWHLKNRLSPRAPDPRQYPIPPDLRRQGFKYWFWNPLKQEFVPSKNP